ncbi:MAG: LTA synthase family protein [Eubacteriales bacterium]
MRTIGATRKLISKQPVWLVLLLSELFLLVFSFSTVALTQYIQTESLRDTLEWGYKYYKSFIFMSILLFAFTQVLYFAFMRLFPVVLITYPTLIVFACINYNKLMFRSEPFIFNDILLAKEAAEISSNYKLLVTHDMVYALLAGLVFLLISLFIKKLSVKRLRTRIFIPVAAVLLFTLGVKVSVMAPSCLYTKVFRSSIWNIKAEYKDNGFMMGFIMSVKRSILTPPEGYDRESVEQAAQSLGYNGIQPDLSQVKDEDKPNIIVIMSETFWDVGNMTGVSYSSDPLADMRSFMEKNGGGHILSGEYGGNTCNVEYEFLTGKSTYYYAPNSTVYQQYVNGTQWSLANYFNDLDYNTLALHPYLEWFWRRRDVYKNFGFQDMYFINDFQNKSLAGIYVKDMSLSHEIIQKYNMYSDKPCFIFSVSMENHGGYDDNRYLGSQDFATSSPSAQISTKSLENFAQGTHNAFEAYKYLTEYFKDVKRPTYVILFGDHAPYFAEYNDLYMDSTKTEQDELNLYKTPLLVWSNTGVKHDLGSVSPFMLTDSLFEMTGLPRPAYISVLNKVRSVTTGFTHKKTLDASGLPIPDKSSIQNALDALGLLQYDAIYGSHYVVDEFKK